MADTTDTDVLETRERILDVAEQQILRLRSGKLRVVDVAAQLGVSHANIYRYFPSREALLNGLVDRWLGDSVNRALAAVDRHSEPAAVLMALIVDMHVATRAKLAAGPGVIDVYLQALGKKAETVERHRDFIRDLAREALARGARDGSFALAPEDIGAAVNVIEAAVTKFIHPLMIAQTLDQDTPDEARAVMTVLLAALKTAPEAFRAGAPASTVRRRR